VLRLERGQAGRGPRKPRVHPDLSDLSDDQIAALRALLNR